MYIYDSENNISSYNEVKLIDSKYYFRVQQLVWSVTFSHQNSDNGSGIPQGFIQLKVVKLQSIKKRTIECRCHNKTVNEEGLCKQCCCPQEQNFIGSETDSLAYVIAPDEIPMWEQDN